jgi:signal peptidase II
MQKLNRPPGKWRVVVFGCILLFIVLADQLSKTWIRANLVIGESVFDIGFFRIMHIQNTGAIFGVFKDHTLALIFVAFAGIIVILILVFIMYKHLPLLHSLWVQSAIALIVAGMIGNQIDRIRLGYVTDFLDLKVWPAFNVADSAGTVGAVIIACCIIFMADKIKYRE